MRASRHLKTFGVFDAKNSFAKLLKRAKSGEEITITRRGKPVARLGPFKTKSAVIERRQAINHLRKRQKRLSLGDLKIRDLINEGRP